jgi:cytochrome c oxidase cbb3-type subunit 3
MRRRTGKVAAAAPSALTERFAEDIFESRSAGGEVILVFMARWLDARGVKLMRLHSQFRYAAVLILAFGATWLFAQQPGGRGGRGEQREGSQINGNGLETRNGYPVRPPEPPALIARGKAIFESNCSFCHGSDARGGETGPNLVIAKPVLEDQHGEILTPIVHSGFPPRMPSFSSLTDADITAIAAFLHSLPLGNGGGRTQYDIVVGNAQAGQAYFQAHCTTCHSVTGDGPGSLAGIGAKYDPKTLQNMIVSGRGGRGGPASAPITVTVTLASGKSVEGALDYLSPFSVSLTEPDGSYHTFDRTGATPKIVVHDPAQWHIDMLPKWNDADIHNLTAYLVTLK